MQQAMGLISPLQRQCKHCRWLTKDILQVDGQIGVVDERGDRTKGLGQAERQQLGIDGLVGKGVQQSIEALTLLCKPTLRLLWLSCGQRSA